MKVVGSWSNGSSQENAFYSNISKSKIDQTSSQGCDGGQHGNHGEDHQQENQSMMVDEQALKEKGVMEAMAKVIKVSNQMMAQIANTTWNLDACQLIIIKGNMTWKLKKCNKTIIHQETIKAINNYLWCFIWQIQSQEMY